MPGTRREVSVRARPRVLLVEDDSLLAMSTESLLIDAGFEVVGVAASAASAISLATSQRPDVAIMDVRLNGKRDGIEAACEILHATGVRSIFVTAFADAETQARGAAASPLGWLQKPYAFDSLVAMVKHAVRDSTRRN